MKDKIICTKYMPISTVKKKKKKIVVLNSQRMRLTYCPRLQVKCEKRLSRVTEAVCS